MNDILNREGRGMSSISQAKKVLDSLPEGERNAVLRRLRFISRRPEVSIASLLPQFDEAGRHAAPVKTLSLRVEDLRRSHEARALVRACIDQLPTQYRGVFMLCDVHALAPAEVAMTLNTTEETVKYKLHRARQALMTLLIHAQECLAK